MVNPLGKSQSDSPGGAVRPWWHADKHADRRLRLIDRARIKTAVREWFQSEGFIEVETSCLQVSPGNETHLHAFATQFRTEAGQCQPFYLHTSPEFACKKLLAAGETRIFTLGPVFRNAESGPLHAPEFTLLEWYRADTDWAHMMRDCEAILRLAARTTARNAWCWRGREACVDQPARRSTLVEAFARHADIRLDRLIDAARGQPLDRDLLLREAQRIGVRATEFDTWSDLFSRVLAERIEPHLGLGAPEQLCAYPTHEAALARTCADDPRFAERFELYVCGVELANGFSELTDVAEQRRRFESAMAEKQRVYGERYPIDEDFLDALAHMPPASGCALGFDRLVMLATGATRIDEVLWTPLALRP